MKITTEKQQQGYIDSTIEGGLKGAAVAAGVLVPATMILRKQSAYFRALPLPLKALGAVSVIVPAITISAEKAGEAYSRTQWTGIGKQEIEAVQRREQERWEKLGTWGQVGDWAKRRKWAIIGTAWVGALGGSYALVAKNNRHQSFAQKIVQARVYAQAATIGLLLVAAFIQGSGVAQSDTVPLRPGDHSWREILEQEGYLQKVREDGQRDTQLADAHRVAQPQRGA
ncbi:putative mitochondrion protein [Papiliotrema laurentii]|uniref:Mitochondrion protein n=1 Tax=Papiliotrema laurentii TaxID=5418 RepID=A0AAD9CS99_PAPLA|nr:putative mitochondrion protein [Papiliotrema laurentii]